MPNTKFKTITKNKTLRASLGTLLLAFAAGCSSSAGSSGTTSEPTAPVSQDPVEAILGQKLTAPAQQCHFDGSIMTVHATAETAIISKRATDSNIVQNGFDCDTPVSASKLKTISIVGSSGDETVILDYTNGLFATGTNGGAGVTVDMGGSSGHDSFGIRGTSTADTITFGADGIAVNTDKFKDISFKTEPDSYAVSLAAGDDKWSASGGAAVGLGASYGGGSMNNGKPIAVYGGAGKDTFDEGTVMTGKESLHGGPDADTLTYASRPLTHPVKITMGSGTTDDGEYDFNGSSSLEQDDIDVDIETVTGTPDNDDIAATANTSSNPVTLNGGAGNDTLAGGAGNDTLNGGDGNDTFYEGTAANGSDVFNGGAGTDTVDYSGRTHGVTVTMDGTKADDGDTSSHEGDNVKADVENCNGSSAADVITGNSSNNRLKGGLGADTLNGGDGDDTFDEGGTNSDRAPTDIDDDVFVCGKGTDTVTYAGRTHALTISIDGHADSGDSAITDLGDAGVPDAGGVADGGDGGPALPGEMDTINLDCENLTGGSGVNHITGSAGPNELTGGPSDDFINGGDGDDTIDGGGGNDHIDGGPGGGDICFDTSGTKLNCEL
ncbi:MAG TPA: hypothetical protein VHC69_08495 [Polyangiaceae bacterium]|nr:hypothetical protein [Polyangiaceae bacterium]